MTSLKRFFRSLVNRHLVLALALGVPIAVSAADIGKTFATPEEAVSALAAAASAKDSNALRVIFGPAADDLENPDRVQATNELNAFTPAFSQHQPDRARVGLQVRARSGRQLLALPGSHREEGWPLVLRHRGGQGRIAQPPHRQERTLHAPVGARLRRGPARIRQQGPRRRRGAGVRAEVRQHPRHERRPLLAARSRR